MNKLLFLSITEKLGMGLIAWLVISLVVPFVMVGISLVTNFSPEFDLVWRTVALDLIFSHIGGWVALGGLGIVETMIH